MMRAKPGETHPSRSRKDQLIWAGVILAISGQLILIDLVPGSPEMGPGQALAGTLLISGALLFGFGASHLIAPQGWPKSPANARRAAAPWYEPKLGLLLVLLLAVLSVLLFSWKGETPLVVGFWVAAMLGLLGIQFWGGRVHEPGGVRLEWLSLLVVAAILALALFARTFDLQHLPFNFDGDYASFGLEARELITGVNPALFRFGWGPAPIMGVLPAAMTLRVFGDSIAGLNASGTISGMLALLGTYLLGRRLFGGMVGLLALAFLAISYAHIAGSRQAYYMDAVPLVIFAVYLLTKGFEEGLGWAVVLGAFLTAFAAMYFTGRLVLPLLIALALFIVTFHRKEFRGRASLVLLAATAGLVALGPMLVVFIRHPDALVSHSLASSIFDQRVLSHEMNAYHVDGLGPVLFEQARRSLLLFHYYVDTGTQFSFKRPLLDPVTASLFTLGVGLAAFHWRRLPAMILIAWAFLGVLLGSFLTGNPPYWSRLMLLLPPAAILAGLALDALLANVAARTPKRVGWSKSALQAVVVILFMALGAANWITYTRVVGTYATAQTRIARFLLAQPPNTQAFLASTYLDAGMREFAFLTPGIFAGQLEPEEIWSGVDPAGKRTILIVTSEYGELAQDLVDRYPEGILHVGPGNSGSEVSFYAFERP